jgi:hypothetical protein
MIRDRGRHTFAEQAARRAKRKRTSSSPQPTRPPTAMARCKPSADENSARHAFVQNVRRGHYELAAEEPAARRLAVAFDELAVAI